MCRWFVYIAPEEECILEDVLITPRPRAHALSKQVHDHYLPKLMSHDPKTATSQQEITARNRMFNVDGFGIAWYTRAQEEFGEEVGPRPALYKHSAPPGNDLAFHSLCQNVHTTNVLAHIRMASATPVVPVNNHPFVFGRHSIMHNGLVSNFSDVKRDMLDLMGKDEYENIKGGTDSEHLAALYMTRLVGGKGSKGWEDAYSTDKMKKALEQACHEIFELQQKTLGAHSAEANSLNICCSDGERMIAFRFRNHAREQPPSLYWSNSAGATLNRKYPDHPDGANNPRASKPEKEHGKHIIVASEPTTYKMEQWNLIEKNHAIVVEVDGQFKLDPIALPDKYLAQAITTQSG